MCIFWHGLLKNFYGAKPHINVFAQVLKGRKKCTFALMYKSAFEMKSLSTNSKFISQWKLSEFHKSIGRRAPQQKSKARSEINAAAFPLSGVEFPQRGARGKERVAFLIKMRGRTHTRLERDGACIYLYKWRAGRYFVYTREAALFIIRTHIMHIHIRTRANVCVVLLAERRK